MYWSSASTSAGPPTRSVPSRKTTKLSYLQLTSCKGHLPSKAIAEFKDTSGDKHTVTSESQAKC